MSAVKYMDARSLAAVPDEAFARARTPRPGPGWVLLLVQIEVTGGEDATLETLESRLASAGVTDDPIVALPDDDRGAERLFGLREAVPASINALVGAAKARVHPEIQKTAADPVVPFDRLADSLRLYRDAFARRGLDYAIWGHISDGNLHPNLSRDPSTRRDRRPARDLGDRTRRGGDGRRAARRTRRRPQPAQAGAAGGTLRRARHRGDATVKRDTRPRRQTRPRRPVHVVS